MKEQVIFISWGNPKENSPSYLEALKGEKLDFYEEEVKNRKHSLWSHLWVEYEYHILKLPNKFYADYEAWKIVFEKIIPFLREDVIFVATSLWWSFVTKYLSENNVSFSIKKLILLAPALFNDIPEGRLGSFAWDHKLFFRITEQCHNIIIYHSRDDSIVLFSDSEKYLKLFPNCIFREFSDKWHFNFEMRITEVEEDIKN